MTTLALRAVSLQGAAGDLPLPRPAPAHPHPAWPSVSVHCHCGDLSLLCLSSLQTLGGRTRTHVALSPAPPTHVVPTQGAGRITAFTAQLVAQSVWY